MFFFMGAYDFSQFVFSRMPSAGGAACYNTSGIHVRLSLLLSYTMVMQFMQHV